MDLQTLRSQITETDEQLLQLLAKRQELSKAVAENKIQHHKNVRDIGREEELLVQLVKKGQKHNLAPQYVKNVFHLIIEDSVLNQQALLTQHANPDKNNAINRVAFLGDKGAYSYLATQKYFSRRPGTLHEIGCETFKEIFDQVEIGAADYAVLPIENTSSGSINEVFDLLQHSDIAIIGELTLPIRHAILTKDEKDLKNVNVLYGHPQVFLQCSYFLSTLGNVQREFCDSTFHAMKKVSESERFDIAAIGSSEGGEMHGLESIQNNIANQKENHSRFIVIAKEPDVVPLQIPAKTTLVMSTVQKPGALVEALIVLKENNISMTKLESRPITGNPWEEMFYIDVEGNVQDGPMEKAIDELTRMTRNLKVLGCYPSEDISHTKVPLVKAITSE